jgi:hypothetical protein
MGVKRLLSALLVVLCCVVFFGCSNNKRTNIEPEHSYYMIHMVPYTFPHKMEKNNDHSFLEFDKDFKNMFIWFDTQSGHQLVSLVITSCTRKSGQIKGTASRIEANTPERGTLVRYSFWSDKNTIYMKTLVTYKVFTAVDSHELVTVSRDQTVAKFARTTPGYITTGGAK